MKNRGPVSPDHPVLIAIRNAPIGEETEEERAWIAANPIDLTQPGIPHAEVTATIARAKAYAEAHGLPANLSVAEVLVMMGEETDEELHARLMRRLDAERGAPDASQ